MAISVVMPALEMAQETGKLLAWRKKEGESVSKGEILLEIETDKAVMEIESPGNGVLAGVKAREGADIPVGQTIAWIIQQGEQPPTEETQTLSARHKGSEASTSLRNEPAAAAAPTDGARLSPKARRLAREHGIDVSSLRGSGPGGAIIEKDILSAVEGRSTEISGSSEALSTVAKLMAERTTQSWTTVPHFFLSRDIETGVLVELRDALSANLPKEKRPSLSDLLVFLTARSLLKHPLLNASWTGSGIRRNADINIALAIAVEDGVISAVIHNTDKLDLADLVKKRQDLADRARAGKLRPSDLSNGTFTISNLGMYNIDAFQAIITPPQAAILAVGRIRDRVVAINGNPAVRPMMTVTLSCDHRVIDGAKGALFLDDLAETIRNPKSWIH